MPDPELLDWPDDVLSVVGDSSLMFVVRGDFEGPVAGTTDMGGVMILDRWPVLVDAVLSNVSGSVVVCGDLGHVLMTVPVVGATGRVRVEAWGDSRESSSFVVFRFTAV